MHGRLSIAIAATLAALAVAAPAQAADGRLRISVLSSAPELVSGGDALLAIAVPNGTRPSQVRVRRNGANVTSSFSREPGGRRLTGVVDGLRSGQNQITAFARGLSRPAQLELFNSPASGPLFSGPQQTPFFCRTVEAGLGPATDANCSAPTQVSYFYRTAGGDFEPLADPSTLPPDGVQTTTRDGRTVDYVVRVETGVIDRSIYRWAILAPGGRLADGWNQRLIYRFVGGCSTGYNQGASERKYVLDDDKLAQGYSMLAGSLNVFNTACNDVLSAEAAAMLKEHVIEALGRRPVWTIGEGGSGGSIQIQLIAQNYPGLLDGLLPGASFPDAASPDYPDCRLLNNYYATPSGAALSNAQRNSISGLADPNGCLALGAGADAVNASEGCDESIVPASLIFNPATNPGGIRCTIWDSMVNVYGTDPATGFARRNLDNVGVQYGLDALRGGDISIGEFLDLNEGIGGFDEDGVPRAARSVADPEALAIAYRTGRVNQGLGGYTGVPVVDLRNYVDDQINVHQSINGYKMRARLDRNGGHGNQVMFRTKGSANGKLMDAAGLDLIGRWLDAIAADDSDRSPAEKVLANKPADAVDACWIGGQRIDAPAQIGAANICQQTYPPQSLPANRAGKPLDSVALKCQLRPLNFADYGAPTPAQRVRLATIYPAGVCDWSKPGVEEQAIDGTWQEFGPGRPTSRRSSRLGLSTKRRGAGRRARVILEARLRPCPRIGFQRVVFEQLRRGNWRPFGSDVTTGSRCRAKATLLIRRGQRGRIRLRARFDRVDGFRSARSRTARVRLR